MNIEQLNIPENFINDINKAIQILKSEGCSEVFLFGSLAKFKFRDESDIDLAIKGLPPSKYFKVIGKLELEVDRSIDLIDLDEEENNFVKIIKEKGELVRVA